MSLDVRNFALQIANNLAYGQVRGGLICPTCHGGRHGEASFGVGRESDRVWWKCQRASCSEQGTTGGHTIAPAEHKRRLDRIRIYEGPALPVDELDIAYFASRFQLEERTVRRYVRVTEDDEYLLPFRSVASTLRGFVVRQPMWSGPPAPRLGNGDPDYPKTVTYPHTLEPTCGWYRPLLHVADSGRVIVVEDQISAMKMAQIGYMTCALLGSGWNQEVVRDIARLKPRRVTLLLDPDAQGTAQQMRRKWGGYFERCDIIALEADPKDTHLEVLREDVG